MRHPAEPLTSGSVQETQPITQKLISWNRSMLRRNFAPGVLTVAWRLVDDAAQPPHQDAAASPD